MKRHTALLSALVAFATIWAASTLSAALPARDEVFAIGIFSPPEHNLVSRDYLFTALPDYEEIDRSSVRDYPSHKTAWTQRGVIVLNDKSVLFYETRSAEYLLVIDAANDSTFYQLKKPLRAKLKCPRPEQDLAEMEFPQAADIFCVALFPWNQGKHFTPESLVEALPKFRLLTKDDVPALAGPSQMGNTERVIYSPAEWQTPAGRRADVLNGVIVMKNRAVLQWITWTPTALAFRNFREGNSYVLAPK
ncbi:MAG: hypothetical protein V4640_02265 [Verrucomicrobiota bacterium]